ncbi:hypothetical protein CAEBREN_06781 [Caenorhabditis brenneri]|uniref:Uncharacterized protein n=1 Tax=Caenorhabditis brenneri TaxID=135651 RepID=G0NE72_CAEBE|nr:hypothetical protein CAEBREN_06781 [Caenorhabditis brenneri]
MDSRLRRYRLVQYVSKVLQSKSVLFLCFLLFLLSYLFLLQFSKPCNSRLPPQIDPNCYCKSQKTGEVYNFCYVDPQNSTSIGKKFNCSYVETLEELKLLNNPGPFPPISNFYKNQDDIVFASITSDDHYSVHAETFATLRSYYPTHKYILYGLNMTQPYIDKLPKNDINFEFRPFDTSRYPKYVETWLHYRFKSIILAEILRDYENVWYIDAHLEALKPEFISTFFEEANSDRLTEDFSPVISFISTWHSNFAVLHPGLLDYLPTNSIQLLKEIYQVGSGALHIPRTSETIEIFKWFVLCALEEKCMNPPGAQLHCEFRPNTMDDYANCFRYDQSVLNLLLLNQYQDHLKYGFYQSFLNLFRFNRYHFPYKFFSKHRFFDRIDI